MVELQALAQLHRSGRGTQTAPDRKPHRCPIPPQEVCGVLAGQFQLRARELLAQADRVESLHVFKLSNFALASRMTAPAGDFRGIFAFLAVGTAVFLRGHTSTRWVSTFLRVGH